METTRLFIRTSDPATWVKRAIANVTLEGLKPSTTTIRLLDEIAAERTTIDAAIAAVQHRYVASP